VRACAWWIVHYVGVCTKMCGHTSTIYICTLVHMWNCRWARNCYYHSVCTAECTNILTFKNKNSYTGLLYHTLIIMFILFIFAYLQLWDYIIMCLLQCAQDISNMILQHCGARLFGLDLPGTSLLMLDFIQAASNIITVTTPMNVQVYISRIYLVFWFISSYSVTLSRTVFQSYILVY